MRAIDPDWLQYLTNSLTQICYCLKISKNGQSLYITDHDCKFEFLNNIYKPDHEMSFSSVKFVVNLLDDQFILTTKINDNAFGYDLIDQDFLREADFTLYQVNWQNVSLYNLLKMGKISDFEIQQAVLNISLHGIAKPLKNQHGRLLQEKCDAQLGGSRCNIDLSLAPYFTNGVVNQAQDAGNFRALLPVGVTGGQFANAWLDWETGENSSLENYKCKIIQHVKHSEQEHEFWLEQDLIKPILQGDQFKLTIICDKQIENCIATFNNAAQFRGFAQMPAKDFRFSYPQFEILPNK